MPSFTTISFTRFCCGSFLIHSIRFDLIALTVDVRDGSQFADVRHDDLIAELLPRCSLVQIEIRLRLRYCLRPCKSSFLRYCGTPAGLPNQKQGLNLGIGT